MTPYPDGPLILRDRFVITAPGGQPVPAGRRTVALCRCGKSASEPFFDGSHARPGSALAVALSAALLRAPARWKRRKRRKRRKAEPAKTARHASMTAGSGQARHRVPGSTKRRTTNKMSAEAASPLLAERGFECTAVAGSLARDSWTPGPETRRASSDFWMSGRTRDRRPASAEALPTLVRIASLSLMPELLPLSADGHKRPPACG